MQLRCLVDGLLLEANVCPSVAAVVVRDGGEEFVLEAVEALFYEVARATPAELLGLERARYRLLRQAEDFQHAAEPIPCPTPGLS